MFILQSHSATAKTNTENTIVPAKFASSEEGTSDDS